MTIRAADQTSNSRFTNKKNLSIEGQTSTSNGLSPLGSFAHNTSRDVRQMSRTDGNRLAPHKVAARDLRVLHPTRSRRALICRTWSSSHPATLRKSLSLQLILTVAVCAPQVQADTPWPSMPSGIPARRSPSTLSQASARARNIGETQRSMRTPMQGRPRLHGVIITTGSEVACCAAVLRCSAQLSLQTT